MRKTIIYGTGGYYEENRHKLPEDLDIIAYADSNPNNASSHSGKLFNGLPVLLPEEFGVIEYDSIFICTDYAAGNRIFQRLVSVGIGSDRIFFLNRIDIPEEWKYVPTDDRKGYLSTIGGITILERHLTDFDIVNEVFLDSSYGFELMDWDCIVIDIGMNVAIASLYFANKPNVKKVYGFEAFTDTYEQALGNIDLNPPEIRNKIVAENFALSDENVRKKVALEEEETGWRNIFSNDESKRQVEIVCRDAGEIVKEIIDRHKEKIILKVDTEGAEFSIFEALDRKKCFDKIDMIMLEYHEEPERLISTLKRYGFKMFVCGKKRLGLIHAVK